MSGLGRRHGPRPEPGWQPASRAGSPPAGLARHHRPAAKPPPDRHVEPLARMVGVPPHPERHHTQHLSVLWIAARHTRLSMPASWAPSRRCVASRLGTTPDWRWPAGGDCGGGPPQHGRSAAGPLSRAACSSSGTIQSCACTHAARWVVRGTPHHQRAHLRGAVHHTVRGAPATPTANTIVSGAVFARATPTATPVPAPPPSPVAQHSAGPSSCHAHATWWPH